MPEPVKPANSGKQGPGSAPRLNLPYVPGADALHCLDMYYPEGDIPPGGWPAVLYAHGGGFVAGDKADPGPSLDYARLALGHGFAMAAVNYRLDGKDKAGLAVDDLLAALGFLRREAAVLGVDADRIALLGPSAGGGLVCAAAARAGRGEAGGGRPVAAAVSLGGAMHITGAANELRAGAPPYYIVHGSADPVVDCGVSEAFCAALAAAGVPYIYVPVEGASHMRPSDSPNLYRCLEAQGKLHDAFLWLAEIFARTGA